MLKLTRISSQNLSTPRANPSRRATCFRRSRRRDASQCPPVRRPRVASNLGALRRDFGERRRPGASACASRTILASLLLACAGSAQAVEFGQGCRVGSLRAPLLLPSAPIERLGFDFVVDNAAAGMPTIVFVGASRERFGSVRLPLQLGGVLRGCSLFASPDLLLGPLVPSTNFAIWSVPTRGLPRDLRVYAQAFSFASDLSAAGASSAYELRFRRSAPTTIVMLPDTQRYSQVQSYFRNFVAQTDWVRNNARDVAFVSHVGDIVQSGGAVAVEWTRADAAMSRLDGVVPYGACIGNHDYERVGNKGSFANYVRNFGSQRYAARSWYGGSTIDGLNHWQVFADRGRRYLHLTLEWRPRDLVLQWAQDVLRRNPGLPVIVSTHEHLGTGVPAARRTSGHTATTSGNNSGEDVYRKLVEPFPQIFMVLSGHVIGEGRRFDTGVFGNRVLELLSDYQGEPEGGNGFLRLLELDRDMGRIAVRAYSPAYRAGISRGKDWSREPGHNYAVSFDFAQHERALLRRVLRFRQGQDFGAGSYTGTQDTYIGDGARGNTLPGQSYGARVQCWCDGDSDHEQAMLRFDGIVGSGAGQLPPRSKIRRAVLTLTTEGSNAQSVHGGSIYRLTRAWSETSTWNSLGRGLQIGVETLATPELSTRGSVTSTGTRSFDVTASVQAFVDGAQNLGWAFVSNGTDGWSFRSSEWGGLVERPMLSVELE